MNIFKSSYIRENIEKTLKKTRFEREKEIYKNGMKENLRGKIAEKVIVDLCNKKNKTNEEQYILKNMFKKDVCFAEVLSNKYKSDIKITFKDETCSYVSIKNTGCSVVGACEVTCDSFNNFFNNKKLARVMKKYESLRFNLTELLSKYQNDYNYLKQFLYKNIDKYLKFILTGTGANLPPDYIIFIDKKSDYIYCSSIDEYINNLIIYSSLGHWSHIPL